MFLNKDFCMKKLIPKEVTIFPEKNKSFNFLLKCIKSTPNRKESLPGVQMLDKVDKIFQNPKLKDFWILSLDYTKSLLKTFLKVKFLFKIFAAHFGTKGILNMIR